MRTPDFIGDVMLEPDSLSRVDIANSIHACDHLIYEVRIVPIGSLR